MGILKAPACDAPQRRLRINSERGRPQPAASNGRGRRRSPPASPKCERKASAEELRRGRGRSRGERSHKKAGDADARDQGVAAGDLGGGRWRATPEGGLGRGRLRACVRGRPASCLRRSNTPSVIELYKGNGKPPFAESDRTPSSVDGGTSILSQSPVEIQLYSSRAGIDYEGNDTCPFVVPVLRRVHISRRNAVRATMLSLETDKDLKGNIEPPLNDKGYTYRTSQNNNIQGMLGNLFIPSTAVYIFGGNAEPRDDSFNPNCPCKRGERSTAEIISMISPTLSMTSNKEDDGYYFRDEQENILSEYSESGLEGPDVGYGDPTSVEMIDRKRKHSSIESFDQRILETEDDLTQPPVTKVRRLHSPREKKPLERIKKFADSKPKSGTIGPGGKKERKGAGIPSYRRSTAGLGGRGGTGEEKGKGPSKHTSVLYGDITKYGDTRRQLGTVHQKSRKRPEPSSVREGPSSAKIRKVGISIEDKSRFTQGYPEYAGATGTSRKRRVESKGGATKAKKCRLYLDTETKPKRASVSHSSSNARPSPDLQQERIPIAADITDDEQIPLRVAESQQGRDGGGDSDIAQGHVPPGDSGKIRDRPTARQLPDINRSTTQQPAHTPNYIKDQPLSRSEKRKERVEIKKRLSSLVSKDLSLPSSGGQLQLPKDVTAGLKSSTAVDTTKGIVQPPFSATPQRYIDRVGKLSFPGAAKSRLPNISKIGGKRQAWGQVSSGGTRSGLDYKTPGANDFRVVRSPMTGDSLKGKTKIPGADAHGRYDTRRVPSAPLRRSPIATEIPKGKRPAAASERSDGEHYAQQRSDATRPLSRSAPDISKGKTTIPTSIRRDHSDSGREGIQTSSATMSPSSTPGVSQTPSGADAFSTRRLLGDEREGLPSAALPDLKLRSPDSFPGAVHKDESLDERKVRSTAAGDVPARFRKPRTEQHTTREKAEQDRALRDGTDKITSSAPTDITKTVKKSPVTSAWDKGAESHHSKAPSGANAFSTRRLLGDEREGLPSAALPDLKLRSPDSFPGAVHKDESLDERKVRSTAAGDVPARFRKPRTEQHKAREKAEYDRALRDGTDRITSSAPTDISKTVKKFPVTSAWDKDEESHHSQAPSGADAFSTRRLLGDEREGLPSAALPGLKLRSPDSFPGAVHKDESLDERKVHSTAAGDVPARFRKPRTEQHTTREKAEQDRALRDGTDKITSSAPTDISKTAKKSPVTSAWDKDEESHHSKAPSGAAAFSTRRLHGDEREGLPSAALPGLKIRSPDRFPGAVHRDESLDERKVRSTAAGDVPAKFRKPRSEHHKAREKAEYDRALRDGTDKITSSAPTDFSKIVKKSPVTSAWDKGAESHHSRAPSGADAFSTRRLHGDEREGLPSAALPGLKLRSPDSFPGAVHKDESLDERKVRSTAAGDVPARFRKPRTEPHKAREKAEYDRALRDGTDKITSFAPTDVSKTVKKSPVPSAWDREEESHHSLSDATESTLTGFPSDDEDLNVYGKPHSGKKIRYANRREARHDSVTPYSGGGKMTHPTKLAKKSPDRASRHGPVRSSAEGERYKKGFGDEYNLSGSQVTVSTKPRVPSPGQELTGKRKQDIGISHRDEQSFGMGGDNATFAGRDAKSSRPLTATKESPMRKSVEERHGLGRRSPGRVSSASPGRPRKQMNDMRLRETDRHGMRDQRDISQSSDRKMTRSPASAKTSKTAREPRRGGNKYEADRGNYQFNAIGIASQGLHRSTSPGKEDALANVFATKKARKLSVSEPKHRDISRPRDSGEPPHCLRGSILHENDDEKNDVTKRFRKPDKAKDKNRNISGLRALDDETHIARRGNLKGREYAMDNVTRKARIPGGIVQRDHDLTQPRDIDEISNSLRDSTFQGKEDVEDEATKRSRKPPVAGPKDRDADQDDARRLGPGTPTAVKNLGSKQLGELDHIDGKIPLGKDIRSPMKASRRDGPRGPTSTDRSKSPTVISKRPPKAGMNELPGKHETTGAQRDTSVVSPEDTKRSISSDTDFSKVHQKIPSAGKQRRLGKEHDLPHCLRGTILPQNEDGTTEDQPVEKLGGLQGASADPKTGLGKTKDPSSEHRRKAAKAPEGTSLSVSAEEDIAKGRSKESSAGKQRRRDESGREYGIISVEITPSSLDSRLQRKDDGTTRLPPRKHVKDRETSRRGGSPAAGDAKGIRTAASRNASDKASGKSRPGGDRRPDDLRSDSKGSRTPSASDSKRTRDRRAAQRDRSLSDLEDSRSLRSRTSVEASARSSKRRYPSGSSDRPPTARGRKSRTHLEDESLRSGLSKTRSDVFKEREDSRRRRGSGEARKLRSPKDGERLTRSRKPSGEYDPHRKSRTHLEDESLRSGLSKSRSDVFKEGEYSRRRRGSGEARKLRSPKDGEGSGKPSRSRNRSRKTSSEYDPDRLGSGRDRDKAARLRTGGERSGRSGKRPPESVDRRRPRSGSERSLSASPDTSTLGSPSASTVREARRSAAGSAGRERGGSSRKMRASGGGGGEFDDRGRRRGSEADDSVRMSSVSSPSIDKDALRKHEAPGRGKRPRRPRTPRSTVSSPSLKYKSRSRQDGTSSIDEETTEEELVSDSDRGASIGAGSRDEFSPIDLPLFATQPTKPNDASTLAYRKKGRVLVKNVSVRVSHLDGASMPYRLWHSSHCFGNWSHIPSDWCESHPCLETCHSRCWN